MMKSKYILIGTLIVLVGGVIAAILFSQQSTDVKTKCCAECRNAFSKSPVGVGPEIARCGEFSTGQPVREECTSYFKSNPLTVYECE